MQGKYLDLRKTYATIRNLISNENIPYNDRLSLYRFLNKLSDNREFELKVNKEFSAIKLKTEKDRLEYYLDNRISIPMPLGFNLVPYLKTRWRLYQFDELFLDGLDYKLAKRIAYDINVAYSLKYSDRKVENKDV